MNFTRIEYFMIAAKYLNITKAANQLFISQPSLSKQIALLEKELGVQLFDRSNRVLRLTLAGKLLYTEFEKVIPMMDAAIEKVKRMKSTCSTLCVGFIESINMGDVTEKILRDFITQAKGVDLYIERCNFEVLRNKILDGSIDIAFTISHQSRKIRDTVHVEIEERKRYAIVSKKHALADREELSYIDLRDETFFLLDNEMVSYDGIFDICKKLGFIPKIRYAPNNETALDYVELGMGVAFFDKTIIKDRNDRLKYYPISQNESFSLVCLWNKSNSNPVLGEFIKYLPDR